MRLDHPDRIFSIAKRSKCLFFPLQRGAGGNGTTIGMAMSAPPFEKGGLGGIYEVST
jgi:hypothetical protein